MKYIIPLLAVIILSTIVSADVAIDITAINNTILPYETATYQLTINNLDDLQDVVNVNSNSNNWIITPTSIVVPPNDTVSTELSITPRSTVGLSTYRIPLYFSSTRTGQELQTSVLLRLSLDLLLSKGYPINVVTNTTVPTEIDPREPFTIKVFMKNNNLRDIESIDIHLKGDLFETSEVTPLEPLSTYRNEFTFDLNPVQKPGQYGIDVIITSEDKTIANEHHVFKVTGYSRISSDREVLSSEWLKTVQKITITNYGNQERSSATKYEVGFFERIFSTTEPQAQIIKEEGMTKYFWDVNLAAQETGEIYITTNYMPLAIGILVIILLVIAYFIFRSPIVLLKETMQIKDIAEGNNEMKVRIYVKNRSSKQVNNLKVIDRVPRIAEMITHAHLGTLQPSKITKSEKRGTIVRWEIESLEPFEERIISYKIRSKLKIVGSMSLPEARVKFDGAAGRERIASSGKAVDSK